MKSEITYALNELSKQLGIPSDQIYNTLVKQAYNDGMSRIHIIIGETLFILATLFFVYFVFMRYDKNDETLYYKQIDQSCDDGFRYVIAVWILGVISLIFFVCIIFNIPIAISDLRNPDYYATQKIINMISQL